MRAICQLSGEPGGEIEIRNSRLQPQQQLWVKKSLWDQGYEPRWLVVLYGRSKIQEAINNGDGTAAILSKDELFKKIIKKKLYYGEPITMIELLP